MLPQAHPFSLVYVSGSVDLPDSYFDMVINKFHEASGYCTFFRHTPGTDYSDTALMHSDVVLVIVSRNNSSCIGKGSYEEYKKAIKYNKTVIIAYQRVSDDKIQFYTIKASHLIDRNNWSKYARFEFNRNIVAHLKGNSVHNTQATLLTEDGYSRAVRDLSKRFTSKVFVTAYEMAKFEYLSAYTKITKEDISSLSCTYQEVPTQKGCDYNVDTYKRRAFFITRYLSL